MFQYLLIILLIYVIYRLLQVNRKRKNPSIRFQYKSTYNRQDANRSSQRARLDDIEEAEYEDITEYEKKKSSK